MKKKIVLFLFLCLTNSLIAQENITFIAKTEKNSYALNEKIRIVFEINNNGDHFEPPNFDGFFAEGPSTFKGMQSSDVIINGKRIVKRKIYTEYTYILSPKKKGTIIIAPAKIEYKGKIYKSNPLEVTITAPNSTTSKPKNNISSGDGVFIIAQVSNSNPHLYEPVNVLYKIYFDPRIVIDKIENSKIPSYDNFWSQQEDIPNRNARLEVYNGKEYGVIEWRKAILYPLNTGSLTLDPLILNLDVKNPVSSGLPGISNYQVVNERISSKLKTITVKKLPALENNSSFSNAVGDLKFSFSTTKTKLKLGESFDIKIEVSGKGNLKLFDLPKAILPTNFEVFEPKHEENIETNMDYGMYGNINDIYTIIPQSKGKFVIKPISFTYFDLKTKKYQTIMSNAISIEIIDGDAITTSNENNSKIIEKPKVFQYIQKSTNLTSKSAKGFFGSWLYFVLILLPIITIPILLFVAKKRKNREVEEHSNQGKLKSKLALKYLSEAKSQLGNKEPFYLAIEKAMHNFLKAKLNIETSEMSKENIENALIQKKASPETVRQFINIMKSAEFARYAPSSSDSMKQDYEKAIGLLSDLEKQIV